MPPAPAAGSEFLIRKEVAARLRVSERTVRRMVSDGDLEQVWVSRGSSRITAQSLERHIARNTVRPLAEVTSPVVKESRGKLNDEFLAIVADTHRLAWRECRDPVAAVMERGNASRQVARNWIRKAQERLRYRLGPGRMSYVCEDYQDALWLADFITSCTVSRTRVRQADNQAKRARLASDLLDDAQERAG